MAVIPCRTFVLVLFTSVLSACGGGDDTSSNPVAPSVFFSDARTPGAPDGELIDVQPVDYAPESSWLCLPGRDDVCQQDVTSTSVAPDGSLSTEPFAGDPDAPIDCFYVYPTVSEDAEANSDIEAGPGERNAALNQAARFNQACRVFAPMYRQVTLSALRAMLAGEATATNRDMAYTDIRAAWRHYLETYNNGRGVVLIGHSQGAGILSRLLASDVGDDETRGKIVSAILVGANIEVDPARPGDGAIGGLPLCGRGAEFGCLIAYTSFRSDQPASAGALFGAASQRGRRTACVNPALLDGSDGHLNAMLPVGRAFESSEAPPPWSSLDEPIETALVSLPGMLSAQCVTREGYTFLSVTVAGDANDARVDDIVGDVVLNGEVQPGWGLHIIDINLALGNLVSAVEAQGVAWLAAHPPADPPDPPGEPDAAPDTEPVDPGQPG